MNVLFAFLTMIILRFYSQTAPKCEHQLKMLEAEMHEAGFVLFVSTELSLVCPGGPSPYAFLGQGDLHIDRWAHKFFFSAICKLTCITFFSGIMWLLGSNTKP